MTRRDELERMHRAGLKLLAVDAKTPIEKASGGFSFTARTPEEMEQHFPRRRPLERSGKSLSVQGV